MARHDWTKHEHHCTFRKPTDEDIKFLVEHMRVSDRKELLRNTGLPPEWGLKHSIESSEVCFSGLSKSGVPFCIFGASRTNLIENEACLWSLSSDEVERLPIEFAIGSFDGLNRIFKALPDVSDFCNWVDVDYKQAVKWLEWLGADWDFGSARPGHFGSAFKRFYISNPYYKEN